MPAKRPVRGRKPLVAAGVVLLGLCLFLLLDRDSFVHGMLFGDMPFSWDSVGASLKNYGYWIFSLYMAGTAFVLFLENRNPDRTLAWLLVLALLPVVGFILYWLVGPNFRYLMDRRRFRLPKPRTVPEDFPEDAPSPLVADTMQLLYRTAGARLETGRDVRVFYDGTEAFERIKARLRSAKRGILLESYIISNDALGNEIKDILIERAQKGVFVCVIYDAVGSWHMGKDYVRALREGGVYARAFLPVAFPMFRGANYRNHRKILVIDGDVAYMGGLNIGDEYVSRNPKFRYWRDTHMEFGGPAVDVLRTVFLNDLAVCGASPSVHAQAGASTQALQPKEGPGEEIRMQIVASGPDTPWDTICKGYLSVISRAREKLWLTSPYLVPGEAMLEALCLTSLSGVDVRLLLPGKADHPLVYWATMNCCDELLRAGVRIFLYDTTGFVHAKTITCDGEILSVGSANLDTRSLQINFEVQAFLYDNHLAAEAEAAFENDMTVSRELTFYSWRNRPKFEKIKENIGKLFSSLL